MAGTGQTQDDEEGAAGAPSHPLFVLAHSNGAATGSDADAAAASSTATTATTDHTKQLEEQERRQQQQPAMPEHDVDGGEKEEAVVDWSRAGVLLGRVDTPALACYTEHGAVPYLTRGK